MSASLQSAQCLQCSQVLAAIALQAEQAASGDVLLVMSRPATALCGSREICGGRREKLTATEAKLKAAVQDKTNVGIEKAALERELKGLRGQAGRLTKVPQPCPQTFL